MVIVTDGVGLYAVSDLMGARISPHRGHNGERCLAHSNGGPVGASAMPYVN